MPQLPPNYAMCNPVGYIILVQLAKKDVNLYEVKLHKWLDISEVQSVDLNTSLKFQPSWFVLTYNLSPENTLQSAIAAVIILHSHNVEVCSIVSCTLW